MAFSLIVAGEILKSKLFIAFLTICFSVTANEVVFNENFEHGTDKWANVTSFVKKSIADCAAAGKKAMRLEYTPVQSGNIKGNAALRSKDIPVKPGVYRISAKILLLENYGGGVYLSFHDAKGKNLSSGGIYLGSAPKEPGKWQHLSEYSYAFSDDVVCARVGVWMSHKVANTMIIDDIVVERVDDFKGERPWKAQYKIRSWEKEKLTPSDFPGPDGIVYPDFTYAGVRKEYADRSKMKVVKLSDFGVKAGDGKDCYDAIIRAMASLPEQGGIIQFDAGKYNLGKYLHVNRDNVVLRGAGKDKTYIDFTYDISEGAIDIYGIKDGMRISDKQIIHGIAKSYIDKSEFYEMVFELDGKKFGSFRKQLHSGNTSFHQIALPKKIKNGKHVLTVSARYRDGSLYAKNVNIIVDRKAPLLFNNVYPRGAVMFRGEGFVGKDYILAKDGVRGNNYVELQNADHPFKKGDAVLLRALETPRRRAETRNACNWGNFRSVILFVTKVEGNKVYFNQPLRIDFVAVDKPFLRKVKLAYGGGVEGMTIKTLNNFWFHTIYMQYCSDCMIKDVKIIMAGRSPVCANNSKFCAVLNCEFDDSFFKGGGGAAYAGWDCCYDCLTDGIVTRNLRHAPLVQWSASGNVFRNGVFYHCDGQWHAGWANENLFENCRIISDTKINGGYGNIFWASSPEDGSHGPNGPRNVVYNCDGYGIEDAVYFGGMNENWIFVGNRLRTANKAGVFIKTASFDHIIKNNVFILEDKKSPFFVFASPDCVGVELIDNTIYGGNGKLFTGLQKPLVNKNNKILKLDKNAPRPKLEVPSIYEWQMKNKKQK